MKVVLMKDVKGTGKKNDVVQVSDGYARNYLIPNKIAKIADAVNLNENASLKNAQAYHKQVELDNAKAKAKELEKVKLNLKLKFGENGKAFGSISSKEIGDELEKLGFEVDRKKIVLNDAIKSVGTFKIKVKLHPEVTVQIEVVVEKE